MADDIASPDQQTIGDNECMDVVLCSGDVIYVVDQESQEVIQMEANTNKRRRDEETEVEEEWQDLQGKKPKKRLLEDIQVSVTCGEKLPKQFALAKLMKTYNITGIMMIKFINPYKIHINFRSEECVEKFINCEAFKERGWRVQKTWEVGVSFGLIKDIDMELSEEELKDNIQSSVEIVSVKRLNRRGGDNWVPSESIRIGFVGPNLPSFIYLCDLRIKVENYIFPVTQCANCWRFGHVKKMCPSNKSICPKCSGLHENCEASTYKCVNCGGKHMALARVCPVFVREKQMRELMSKHNVTYKKAMSLYIPPLTKSNKQPTSTPIPQSIPTSNQFEILNASPSDLHSQPEPVLSLAQPSSSHTYAEVTMRKPAAAASKSHQNNNYRGKHSKHISSTDNESNATYEGNNDFSERDLDSDRSCTNLREERNEKLISFGELIEKLKEVIFKKNLELGSKIKLIVNMIKDWIVAYICGSISDMTAIKTLFSLFGKNG